MTDPMELMLADLREKYEALPTARSFARLYDDPEWGHMFAVLHKRLNDHFTAINGRAKSTHHYWADNSRDLLTLIDDIEAELHLLNRSGREVELIGPYEDALERCRPWLSPSGGSHVPDDFDPIRVVTYDPVFVYAASNIRLEKQPKPVPLKMVGSGSYAHVYSYLDPDYGIQFAVKRAKRGLGGRDLERFKQEYEVLKGLSYPYVVEVYRYDATLNEYRMEYCDTTLREYVSRKNSTLSFAARKRIALQFLYGINFLHHQGLLHRDISLQNVLVKVFDAGAVLVKLSDFGLVKDQSKEFTRTQTEMKGTLVDPMLESFKDYAVVNEVYTIAWVLAYIFKGRESLPPASDDVGRIIHKCAINDLGLRYQTVAEVIADVERLEAPSVQPTA
ncbi:protein kinase family protein [Cellulomonas sp. PSBB021]|uniref:protein kinase family protein n=1 Tax=Cellulomonas sp. PSBB021 TaxID=2003551 RepID=UPI000B8D4613|nr:protein kinase family protein [Cellulomonas sp. PSBB021]ASR55453.1 serine/threonine protein kinase [Cellulomonas sp. PSBB021]